MRKNVKQNDFQIEIFEGKKPPQSQIQNQAQNNQPSSIKNKIVNPNFMKNNKQSDVKNTNNKTMIHKIKQARTSGVINISDMNLNSLPPEIFDENISFEDINWWELVDITKIDASTNKISDVTENFSNLPALNYLKLSNNLFKNIPNTIYNLHLLKYLDFSSNKLTNLSENIKNLSSLVELNLSNNEFNFISEEIGFLKNLEVLNISSNKLNFIPKSMKNLLKLKKLDCSLNNIETIPSSLGSLGLLEELNFHKNKIKEIEQGALEPLINLKLLDLHVNNLKSFVNVPISPKLHSLNLSYNKIEHLENLSNCPNLNDFDVNNNKIEAFPSEILNLKFLKTLNITNNSIQDLPPELCFLKELVRLYIEGNPLKKLNSKLRGANAETIKNYLRTKLSDQELIQNEPTQNPVNVQLANITNLLQFYQNKSLKMSNAKLTSIPLVITKINRDLVSIDFSHNNISDLSTLEDLREEVAEINLSGNKIMAKHLAKNIVFMESLRTLDLKNNLLDSFFEDTFNSLIYGKDKNLCVFYSLEYLDLSMNKLNAIPSILTLTRKLRILLLSNNEIKNIDVLTKNEAFSNLDTLDLGTNKIGFLSEDIHKNFNSLKSLNLENNELKTIPTELGFLNLTRLSISGNPLKQIRFNVISGGTPSILDYLRKMHKGAPINQPQIDSFSQGNSRFNSGNKQANNFNNNAMEVDSSNNLFSKNSNNQRVVYNKMQEASSGNTFNNNKLMYNENINYDLETLNQKILEVEYEMQNVGNNAVKKQEIRRKLNELIRLRANFFKN